MAVVFYYRKEFGELLQKLFEYYTRGTMKCNIFHKNFCNKMENSILDYRKDEIAIYRQVILYTMFSTVLLASGGLTTCTIYVFTPILKNLFFLFTGQPTVREQPFEAV